MTTTASARSARRSTGIGEVLRLRIELWIAVVFMAIAFGAGMAVRVAATDPTASSAVTTVDPGTDILAPPLTDQQIEQGLPAGHPDLTAGGNGGSGGAATGAKDGAKDETAGGGGGGNGGSAGSP